MRIRLTLLALLAFALSASAHADIIATFAPQNLVFSGGNDSIQGTIVIDTTTGTMVSEDLTLVFIIPGAPTAGGGPHIFTFTNTAAFTQSADDFSYLVPGTTITGLGTASLSVVIKGTAVGYTGGSLCPTGTVGCDAVTTFHFVRPTSVTVNDGSTSGSLTETSFINTSPPSTVPEPSSLVLLGTAMLGLAAGVRRKFLKV